MRLKTFIFSVVLVLSVNIQAQRFIISGTVVSGSEPLQEAEIINIDSQETTQTDMYGKFDITVVLGEKIAVFAKGYEYETFFITKKSSEQQNWVLELEEDTFELDEVTLTEEEKKILRERNNQFKRYYYEQDYHSEVTNIATNGNDIQYGLDFTNMYKAMREVIKKDKPISEQNTISASVIIRSIYNEAFFVDTLGIPKDQIAGFLYFCEQDFSDRNLLKKQNEFQLLDYLVTKSLIYKLEVKE